MPIFIEPSELYKQLKQYTIRIVDCRFDLTDPDAGRKKYETEHLVGAVYMDLEMDLSGPIKEHGGRHPLPEVQDFIQKLEKVGITNEMIVVAYDDEDHAFASRFWWMMKYVGHENVFILNGGFRVWKEQGYETTQIVPQYKHSTYQADINSNMIVNVEDVRKAIHDKETILIDSRDFKRYIGEFEPIDKKAGHIPTAISFFWKNNIENGRFKKKEDLIKQFSQFDKEKKYIVYCGSGVTACPNIAALKEAGFGNVRLYPGSWSDWISYEDNPIAVGEN